MKSFIGAISLALLLVSLGCSSDESVVSITPDEFTPPEFVYIPGDGHRTDLTITISDDVSVGSPALVSARAVSGPWKKVKYSETDPCSTWYVRPMEETDLTANVEWIVNPPGAGRFATVTQSTAEGFYREVLFDGPGEFQLTATTTFPTEATSNTIVVSVRQ